MALKSDGTVWTWGRNLQGQLGDASTTDSSTPVQVSGLSGVTTIASGWFHSLAVKSERPLGAWGYNDSGQLGDDSTDNRAVPVPVSGLSDLTAVSGGELHSLALRAHGTVWAWGDNYSGQLGNGSTDSSEVPVQVNGLTDVKAVAAGSRHSLALKSDGTVWGWGLNETSIWQLGTGSAGNQDTPVQVGSLEGVTAIAAGAQHGLALLANGTVWGWGANNYGQLGDGSYDNRSTPVQVMTAGLVDPLTDVAAIACGIGFSLALRSDGTVWAWGDDQYGQLGNGAAGSSPTPVQVTELPLTRAIAGGAYHCLAVQADGTVRAWGDNWYGQLGDGSSGDGTNKNAPVQVTGLTGATGVAGGVTHSLALLSDGTVRAWGWNSEGQLGDDSGSNSTAPVAVANVTSVTTVAAGWRHSLATGAMEGGPTTEEVSLVLTAGWNMVSVPVVPADTSRAAVFPPADVVAVYTWNPSQKSYDVPTNIAPEVGYWVAVTENKTITVTGTPMTTWPSSLITGWNMVGSVYGTAVSVNDLEAFAVDPSGSVLTNAIYWWDPEGKSYVAETSIVKGQGYWMAATADCTLTMTAPV
jgi:alpha-tubulin suppressor-like RCC1 family protein